MDKGAECIAQDIEAIVQTRMAIAELEQLDRSA